MKKLQTRPKMIDAMEQSNLRKILKIFKEKNWRFL